jgi:addiction module HigA family antidote
MTIMRENLYTIDLSDVIDPNGTPIPPIHPGEILRDEFLAPLGITQYALAKAIGVPPRRINEIVHGLRGISADTALRLGLYFETSSQFWSNLQVGYETELAQRALASTPIRILPYTAHAPERRKRAVG